MLEYTLTLVSTLTILPEAYSCGRGAPRLSGMPSTGLRELKKARARRHIADTAARLFAERGYEHVAVSDVARAAEVAEQTVYNYFPTKDQLVTDRDQQIQDRLCELIRSRPPDVTPAAAIRDYVLASVAGIRDIVDVFTPTATASPACEMPRALRISRIATPLA